MPTDEYQPPDDLLDERGGMEVFITLLEQQRDALNTAIEALKSVQRRSAEIDDRAKAGGAPNKRSDSMKKSWERRKVEEEATVNDGSTTE
jgi:hypothetical protein